MKLFFRKTIFERTLHMDPHIQYIAMFNHFSPKHYNYILSQDKFQQLINSTEKYELIITSNAFSEPFFKLGHVLNASLVQVCYK